MCHREVSTELLKHTVSEINSIGNRAIKEIDVSSTGFTFYQKLSVNTSEFCENR